MPVKIISSGGGSVTLSANTTASNYTLNLPAASGNIITSADSNTVTQAMLSSGLAGTGPAFSAKLTSSQSVTSGVYTKVTLGIENFDTNSNFDNVTNYRFTPTVAGYYQFNASLYQASSGSANYVWPIIYKNGAAGIYGTSAGAASGVDGVSTVAGLLYMNGSTDYVELYCYVTGTSPSIDTTITVFSGFLARTA